MAQENVVVVSAGMITSVGLSAAETAASVRAGIMRFTSVPWHDHRFEPITLAEVAEDGLPPLATALANRTGVSGRQIRLLRLGTLALRECTRAIGPGGEIGLHLALPESETLVPLDRPAVLRHFAEQTAGGFDIAQSEALARGRAGGLLAIEQAAQAIEKGTARFALAGGIDTYRDSFVLGTLDIEKRLKSAAHLDGFIPGEGAAFVLLASRTAAKALKVRPLAQITRVSTAYEEGHLYSEQPYLGEAVSDAVQELVAGGAFNEPVEAVYSSMNGENHWAKEWGIAFLRNKAAFAPEHELHHPADCLGDTGAACGPLMVGLAATGLAHKYCRGPSLVYASSDHGDRAAIGVTAYED